jgi:hypothetical protein
MKAWCLEWWNCGVSVATGNQERRIKNHQSSILSNSLIRFRSSAGMDFTFFS